MNIMIIPLVSLITLLAGSILFFRFYIRREYQSRKHLFPLPSLFQAMLFFIWGGFPALYLPRDWPITHMSSLFRIAGQVGLWTGLTVILGGMVRLGFQRSCGMRADELKLSGLYRYSRNPQILGCVLYVSAFVLLWPSWLAVGWGISLVIILHLMVITEEEHLGDVFGQEYEKYFRKVPRYLGIIKTSEEQK